MVVQRGCSGHEIPLLNIVHNDALAGAPGQAASGFGVRPAHREGSLKRRVKSAPGQKAERIFLFVDHLHARKVRTHDRAGAIDQRLIQRLGPLFLDQLRTDPLQQLRIGELFAETPPAVA